VNLDKLVDTSRIGPWNAVAAVAILIATWVFWRMSRKGSFRLLGRLDGISDQTRLVTSRIVGYLVLLTGIGVALSMLGAALQPVLTVALLVIAVLVLALRGVAENFAAGVIIQTRHPVRIGDLIESGRFKGRVTELNGRTVIIRTGDGLMVHIPNETVLHNPIVNHTTHGTLRGEVRVQVIGGDPRPASVTGIVVDAARHTHGVRAEPGPYTRIVSVETDRLTLLLRFWHHWPDTHRVTGEVVAAVAYRLREAGRVATVTISRPAPGPPPLPPAPAAPAN
jgi:small conductance mechanosensitive channel